MADKRTHASPKCCDLTTCQQHSKKKRRKKDEDAKIKPGQNILECTYIKQPKRNVVQYLYVDPVFIEHATCTTRSRFRAGGVPIEDNFYDCASESDWDENKALVVDPLQQRLYQITDVINHINDPKEFKDLLKEMAYTSYILYRSFRKAYGKTKKDKEHKCEYCRQKEQREKDRYNNPENRDPIEYVPLNFNGVGDDGKPKGNLCPICYEPLAENPAAVTQSKPDYSQSRLKKSESQTTQPAGSKLMIGSTPTVGLPTSYTGINEQASQTQKPTPSKNTIKEQSSQTVNPEGMLTNASPSKSCVCASGPLQDPSKALFLKPISISIPLKLQVESENMKPRFIETEIVLKSYLDQPPTQQPSSTQAANLAANPSQNPSAVMPSDVVSTSPSQPEPYLSESPSQAPSDIFYSCISSSGIIEPVTEQIPKGEASLNEIFDIVNKRKQTPKDVPPPPPALAAILAGNLPQSRFEMPQIDENAKTKILRDQLLQEIKDTLDHPVAENALKPIPIKNLKDNVPVKVLKPVPDKTLERTVPEIAPKPLPKNTLEPTVPEIAPKPLPKNTLEPTVPEIAPKPLPKNTLVTTVPEIAPKMLLKNTLEPTVPEIAPKPLPKNTLASTVPEIAPKPLANKTSERFVPEITPKPLSSNTLLHFVPEIPPKTLPKNTLVGAVPENAVKPFPSKLPKESPTIEKQPVQPPTIPKHPIQPPTVMPTVDPRSLKSSPTSSSLKMVMHKNKPTSNQSLQRRASWSHFSAPVPEPTGLVSETIQTDVTAVHPTGHYKRNELRSEIQEDLQELLEPKPKRSQNKYDPDEREDILLDLSKLFHPDIAPTLPKETNKDNTLDDIRYLLEPPKTSLDAVASRVSILVNIRYILQPKLKKKPAKKIYSKAAREKILEDLHEVLTPKKHKKQNAQRVRDSVLNDLRFMLDAGKQKEHTAKQTPQPALTNQPARPQQSTARASGTTKLKKPNEVDNSVLADLIYLLDTNQVHPPKPAATSQPVATTEPVPSTQPQHHIKITQPQPTTQNEIGKKPPITSGGSSPDSSRQKEHKVDQAKLNPSSEVVDQTPKGWTDTTKAEGLSLASTLSTATSSDTFFARMYDTSPENFRPRSTLKDDDSQAINDKGHEAGKSLLQNLIDKKDNDLDKPSRDVKNDLPEFPPKPKMLSHATQSSNEYLTRPAADDIHKDSDKSAANKLDQKRNLYRLSSDKSQPKSRKSTDGPRESKVRKPKELSQIMEGSEMQSLTSPISDSANESLPHIDNKTRPKAENADVKLPMTSQNKSPGVEPRKSNESKLNFKSGSITSTGRYGKPTDDPLVYNDRTRYSELMLEAEKRPSISRYAKPIDDLFAKPQEKVVDRTRYSEQLPQNESRLPTKMYDKPNDYSFVKPQDKVLDKTRHSEPLLQNESRLSRSRYDKPNDYSFVTPLDKIHDSTRYSEQPLQNENRPSRSIYDKPIADSFVKPQDKIHDSTRYSEQLPQNESRPSISRYDKPIADSFVKPQDKIHNSTRYSEQLLQNESQPSRSKYDKPIADSFVKRQDKIHDITRHSEQPVLNENQPSKSKYEKPIADSFIKPQDKIQDNTRYSEQLPQNESRPSISRYDKNIADSFVTPQDKIHDSTRHSEQPLKNKSRLPTSKNAQPFDYSFATPLHDSTRHSEQLLQNESRPSSSRYGKPIADSFVKPQDKIHDKTPNSEQLLQNESPLSPTKNDKSINDSFVKPQEKIHERTPYSDVVTETDKGPSVSRYGKPLDDSLAKPQEKLHDNTRYSEPQIKNESPLPPTKNAKPINDSFVKPQEKIHERTPYSDLVNETDKGPLVSRYGKPLGDSFVKPQDKIHDRTRYSEPKIQNESRLSTSTNAKPIDNPFVKPQEKIHERTPYSDLVIETDKGPSVSRYGKPLDDSIVKPQDKIHDRTRYSEQQIQNESRLLPSKTAKPIDDSFVKPQEKIHERTRYSDQVVEAEKRPSASKYDKLNNFSFVKPQENIHERTRYSDQLLQNESRTSISKNAKPIDNSFVKPQEKIHDRTRYSDLVTEDESKPYDFSFVKPQDKNHDRTRYSDLVVEAEKRPSASKYDKLNNFSFVKPQENIHERTRYSQQLIQNESRISTNAKPIDDSFAKPLDRKRYSDLAIEAERRPSSSRSDKPNDFSFVKPQEKIHERTRYSDQFIEAASKPNDFSFVKPQEKIHERTIYSEQLLQNESRISTSQNDKPIDNSFVKPQEKIHDRTRYSDLVIGDERRPSASRSDKPNDFSFVKPQEKIHERTRYSEQLLQNENRISTNAKPIDDSFVKPQEKIHDRTRYSDLAIEAERRPSASRSDKPNDFSFVRPQEKLHDRTRYSDQVIEAASKPNDFSFVKPQEKIYERTRYSEQLLQNDSQQSTNRYGKPTDDSFVQPQDKNLDGTRYSGVPIETDSRPSISIYGKPSELDQLQESFHSRTRYSDLIFETGSRSSRTRYSKTTDRRSITSVDARQSKTYHNRQGSMATDNTRDSAYTRQPILPQDTFKRSSRQSLTIIRNQMPSKTALESQDDSGKEISNQLPKKDIGVLENIMANAIREDIDNWKNKEPKHKTPKSSKEDINKPRRSDMDNKQKAYSPLISHKEPDFQHNMSRMSDDKTENLPEKYSDVPQAFSKSRPPLLSDQRVQRQVSQYRDSVNDFPAFTENKIKPSKPEDVVSIRDIDEQQRMPAKISNESQTIVKSASRLPATGFAKPKDTSNAKPQPNLMADSTRTSEVKIETQSRQPPAKRDSQFLGRPSYISVFSDLSATQSKQIESPYKRKADLSDDNLIRSRSPKESLDDREKPIEKSRPSNKKLSSKPKTMNIAEQSAPNTYPHTPLKSDTTVEPKHKPRKLFDGQQESELHLQPDHLFEPNRPVSASTPNRELLASKTKDPEQLKILDTISPKASYDQPQNLPATTSNDSKLIIHYESRSSINRFGKPSVTSTRHRDSEIIIQTESRHPSRNDSQIYISAPHYNKRPVTATDDNKGQPILPKDTMIKSDIPKTFQEPITITKTPSENPSFLLHPGYIKKSEDFIPFKDRNRLSLPVPQHQREYGILDKKYSTPNFRTNDKDSYPPQGQVLQTEQDKNKPKLSKQTVEQQTSPTYTEESPSHKDPSTAKDYKPIVDDQEDVFKDKPLATPEVVEEKPLIYLYSRPTHSEENKENQQPTGNLQLNLRTSISSELLVRSPVQAFKPEDKTDIGQQEKYLTSPVEATKPEVKTDIVQQEENLPSKINTETPVVSEPPAIKVPPPTKDNSNFKTAKAMVLKPMKRKDSITKASETLKSPSISINDLHNKTANTTMPPLETEFKRPLISTRDSNLSQHQDSKTIMRKPNPVPVLKANKEPEIPSSSPAKIEQTPKTKENANIPEFNISQFSPQLKTKQSTSSLIISHSKPGISTTADNKQPLETTEKERLNISTVKPDAINLSPSRPEPEGIVIISKGTKSTPKKPPPSQASNTSPTATTATTEPTTTLEPPSNQGYVTSITIQAKTTGKPK